MALTEEEISRVVEHMNSDHADTLVSYVRYFGGVDGVISASLRTLTHNELHIDVVAHSLSCQLSIPLIRPVGSSQEAREVLVEMARQAHSGLNQEQS